MESILHDIEEVLPLKDTKDIFKEFNKALLPSLCKKELCNVSFQKKSTLIASTGATRLSIVFKNLFDSLVAQDMKINIKL